MEWSILRGDRTGITTFFVDEGIDTGERIVLWKVVDVSRFTDVTSARGYLFSLDGEMFAEALAALQEPDFKPMRQTAGEGKRYYVMSRLFSGVVDRILGTGPASPR